MIVPGCLSRRAPLPRPSQPGASPAARPPVRPHHLPPLPGRHHAVRAGQTFQHSNIKTGQDLGLDHSPASLHVVHDSLDTHSHCLSVG